MIPPIAIVVVSILAVAVGGSNTRIIIREHRWQAWFVQRPNAIAVGDASRHVMPRAHEVEAIETTAPGYIANVIQTLSRVIVVGWVTLGLVGAWLVVQDLVSG